MTVRRDRRLGLITPNMQRYDAEKAADWLDAVERQVCPFCNEGPFTVVAIHVWMVHGVDRRTLRVMLGLPVSKSICDPSFHDERVQHNRRNMAAGKGVPPRAYGRYGKYDLTVGALTARKVAGLSRSHGNQEARTRVSDSVMAKVDALVAERGSTRSAVLRDLILSALGEDDA